MAGIKSSFTFFVFQASLTTISLLPRRFCLFLGRTFGFLIYFFDKKHRNVALQNLKLSMGEKLPDTEIKHTVKKSFVHFGQAFFDLVKFSRLKDEKKEKLITVEGSEIIDKAIQQGKGALLFSAHLGSWEIAPFIISKKAKISVIARPLDHKLLEKKLLKIRTGFGAEVIHKHQASKQVLRLLRKNEMVAILIDQNVLRSQAIFVDFFGKPAATTPSLAMFHLRTSSPLIPVFCYPSPTKGYIIKIMPPLDIILSGDHSEDILKITQLCTKIIEDQIQKDPSLWMWFHNRWKTRPVEETTEKGA